MGWRNREKKRAGQKKKQESPTVRKSLTKKKRWGEKEHEIDSLCLCITGVLVAFEIYTERQRGRKGNKVAAQVKCFSCGSSIRI